MLAAVAAGVIIYASLYPLSGWSHPAGWSAWREIQLPWPKRAFAFDVAANVLGYVPLGCLVVFAFLRGARWSLAVSCLAALCVGAGLSVSMEVLQNFLPRRVPSAMDWVCNVSGTAIGILLACGVQTTGLVDSWLTRHERWFDAGAAGGTTLLLLWPLALLFPSPVPLGLGQVVDLVATWMLDAVAGTLAEAPVLAWTGLQRIDSVAARAVRPPLPPSLEIALVSASLLAPCLVAFSIMRPGWRRAVLAGGAAVLALATLTLSTALNFGPEHAGAWRTAQSLQGIAAGCAIGCALFWISARVAAVLGIAALLTMVTLTAQAPVDPYFAVSLAAWEQGRFIHFHGAAQWIGRLWPFAAVVYLVLRLAKLQTAPDRLSRMQT